MIGLMSAVTKQENFSEWSFRVNTEAGGTGEKKTAIPFNLTGQNEVVIIVDWGDGTKSTLNASQYSFNDSTASVHEYASPGIYTVTAKCKRWHKAYVFAVNGISKITADTPTFSALYWWRRTVTHFLTPLPKLAGTHRVTDMTNLGALEKSAKFSNMLCQCSALESICENLMANNPNVTNFTQFFYGNESLPTLPASTFAACTMASTFEYTFGACFSLQTLPSDLFRYNVLATNFSKCFYGCDSLQALPEWLFRYNSRAIDFTDCFCACTALTDIPSSLFAHCTSATKFG